MEIGKLYKIFKLSYIRKTKYSKYYRKLPIVENDILLDSQHGTNLNGNIFYILKELSTNPEYNSYNLYLLCKSSKCKSIKKWLKNKEIYNIKIIKNETTKYYKLFAQAKILITDTSFPTFYIKKEGQIVFNVWHGTPFKTLGRSDKSEFYRIGNIQRNFVFSDYLLYPNEYMMKNMIKDYMLENISDAKILLEGYPRNEIFFDEISRKSIRKKLQLTDKEVFAYMPTWRGLVNKVEECNEILNYLTNIDKELSENQVLYVKLHPFAEDKLDYKRFNKIKPFPTEYETYEFLNIADCLITDYSSVFFDFANTRKKVILFAYDEDKYLKDRGLYIKFDELPFPKVSTIKELIKELNTPKNYNEWEFIEKFCSYDNKYVSKRICELIVKDSKNDIKMKEIPKNNKPNILIYPGNLAKNGITTSFINLANNIDVEKYNYYVTYATEMVCPNKDVLLELPQLVNYIPITGRINMSIKNEIFALLYKLRLISVETLLKHVKKNYQLEIKRLYSNIKFDTVIQFNGYDYKKMTLYSLFDANKVIYVHNDMYSEIFVKGNQKLDICKYAYNTYDKIALVTEDLIEPTSKILNKKEKFYICNNTIDYNRILKMSREEVTFDKKTESNVEFEDFKEILDNKDITKIIAIGRYSKEKGNDRLLDAFEIFWKANKDSYLIIIGGYGKEYNNLIKKLNKMQCKNNVALIKYMSNPYTVLNECDGLILPSRYEGFGLVLIEADVLKKPVVSTNIVGPTKFMKSNNGELVENSTNGIIRGLELLYNNKIKPMNVDYEKYNKNAIEQFYNLLKKER